MKFINKSEGAVGVGRLNYGPGEFEIAEPFSDKVSADLDCFKGLNLVEVKVDTKADTKADTKPVPEKAPEKAPEPIAEPTETEAESDLPVTRTRTRTRVKVEE